MEKHEIDGKLCIFLKTIANAVDEEELHYDYGDSDLL